MTITRVSAADLLSSGRGFTADEAARLDLLSNEEIEAAALSDPDAQPSTPEMLRRAQAYRRQRLMREQLLTEQLGATLSLADADMDLPIWNVTDENGRIVRIKAADVRRSNTHAGEAEKVLKIEAQPSNRVAASPPVALESERQKA